MNVSSGIILRIKVHLGYTWKDKADFHSSVTYPLTCAIDIFCNFNTQGETFSLEMIRAEYNTGKTLQTMGVLRRREQTEHNTGKASEKMWEDRTNRVWAETGTPQDAFHSFLGLEWYEFLIPPG